MPEMKKILANSSNGIGGGNGIIVTENFQLLDFPVELLFKIMQLLDMRSICRMETISFGWKSFIQNCGIWKRIFERDFGLKLPKSNVIHESELDQLWDNSFANQMFMRGLLTRKLEDIIVINHESFWKLLYENNWKVSKRRSKNAMKRVIKFYERRQNERNQKLHPHVTMHGHSNSTEHAISSTIGTFQRTSDFTRTQRSQQQETNDRNRRNNRNRAFATRVDLFCFIGAVIIVLLALFIQFHFR